MLLRIVYDKLLKLARTLEALSVMTRLFETLFLGLWRHKYLQILVGGSVQEQI